MKLFKKLFGLANLENAGASPVRRQKAIGFICSTVVFSHGWNDPSELIHAQFSMPLAIVESENEINDKLSYWNKIYYNQINHHYSISEDQLDAISDIVNVPQEKYRELYAYWPDSVSEDLYSEIFKKLSLKFVQYKPANEEQLGKFFIRLNEKFWNIKTHNSTLLVDIVNTYERDFLDFEFFHDSYEEAMNYGVIIMDRLCNQRGPDNSYYYQQAIKQQANSFGELPIFNYNSLKHEANERKKEYERIISEMKPELELIKSTIENISEKPFEVVEVFGG